MLGLAAELAGKHRSFQANSVKTRRVLSFNYLGKRLCRLARVGISGEEIQAAVRQLLEWVWPDKPKYAGSVFLIGQMSGRQLHDVVRLFLGIRQAK